MLTPVLALVVRLAQAVGVLLPMLVLGDMFALYMDSKEWDLDLVRYPVVGMALLTRLSAACGPSRE